MSEHLYSHFEGIGNNCEFGIVQRQAGFDPPGLFRNVGFYSPDSMISAIDRGLAEMFDDGKFSFLVPNGWPDWRLDCNVYGITFHTAIPSSIEQNSEDWGKKTNQVVKTFRFLKRLFLESLQESERIFVFRHNLDSSTETIARMYAAIRKHGKNWLLYVTQNPEKPSGWVEYLGDGLLLGGITHLSNENPPDIDFNAWEKIARESLDIKLKSNERPRAAKGKYYNELFPNQTFVVPPLSHLEVVTHSVAPRTTVNKPIFHMFIDGLKQDQVYQFEIYVYLPSDFTGTNVSVLMWGTYAEHFNEINLSLRETWQHLFVKAKPSSGATNLVPSLILNSFSRTEFYSCGWRLTAVGPSADRKPDTLTSASRSETLGYLFNNGGLNNQTGALNGLAVAAYATKRPMFLPEMYNLDHTRFLSGTVAIEEVFEPRPFRNFAEKYGIQIVDRPSDFESDDPNGWKFFGGNPNYFTPHEFGVEFSNSLVPRIRSSELFHKIDNEIFGNLNVKLVVQLRIEKDWKNHASGMLKATIKESEDYDISFQTIFFKIFNTLKDISGPIYIVCDERGLPFSKEEIRIAVKSEFNYDLYWKSDFLSKVDFEKLSVLERSLIDFEMAIQSEYFVGLTRSTFSNKVCWHKRCREGIDVRTHYIYNNVGPTLSRRYDNGVFPDPFRATLQA